MLFTFKQKFCAYVFCSELVTPDFLRILLHIHISRVSEDYAEAELT